MTGVANIALPGAADAWAGVDPKSRVLARDDENGAGVGGGCGRLSWVGRPQDVECRKTRRIWMYEFITHRSFASQHAEQAIARTAEICAICEKQPGLIDIRVYRPHDFPNEIYLVEQWSDEGAFRAWIDTSDFKRFQESVKAYDPVTNFMPSQRVGW